VANKDRIFSTIDVGQSEAGGGGNQCEGGNDSGCVTVKCDMAAGSGCVATGEV